MKIAIMQPYIFPYIGYFQLAYMTDHFVFYDDVSFIKKGYINRNSFLVNGEEKKITFPVKDVSQNRNVNEHYFVDSLSKQLKTIAQSYSKAPNFKEVFPLVESVLSSSNRNASLIASKSVIAIMNYLGLPFKYSYSSEYDYDRNQNAEDKIIALSKALNAQQYINSIGGKALYNGNNFASQNIDLLFSSVDDIVYDQQLPNFTPNLSMIDVLMWCSKEEALELLKMSKLTNSGML